MIQSFTYVPKTISYNSGCPNCGSGNTKHVKGTFNDYRCTMCGSVFTRVSPDLSIHELTPETLYKKGLIELSYKQFSEAKNSFDQSIDRAPDMSQTYFARCLATNHCVDRLAITGPHMIEKIVSLLNADGKYLANITSEDATKAFIYICGTDWNKAVEFANEVDMNVYTEILNKIAEKAVPAYYDAKYMYAISKQNSGGYDNLLIAYERFRELGSYKDSKARAAVCFNAICNERYRRAVNRYNNEILTDDDLHELENEFRSLIPYKNSAYYANECYKAWQKRAARAIARKIGLILTVTAWIYLIVASIAHLPNYLVALIIFVLTAAVCAPYINDHPVKLAAGISALGVRVAILFGEQINSQPLIFTDDIPFIFTARMICAPLMYGPFILVAALAVAMLISAISGIIKLSTLGRD